MPPKRNTEFSELSNKLHASIAKEIRQNEGIYFTPRAARARLFEILREHSVMPTRILEPSCGSGEFVDDAHTLYPEAHITAVEKNESIYNELEKKYNTTTNITLYHMDFLEYESPTELPDLIIGNPPYFVTKTKNPACMTGRPNIYVEFLYRCLTTHLESDAVLAFILPTSLYNAAYYEPMRKYIYNNCQILHVETLGAASFDGTTQDTMLLVIKKSPPTNHAFFYCVGDSHYISPYYKELAELTAGSTTLRELHAIVKTGQVVWNQEKDKLLDDPEGAVPLIYSTNIVDRTLVLGNIEDRSGTKKQYIKGFHKAPLSGSALLINRGYGNVYKFNYARVSMPAYYAENHVNVVVGPAECGDEFYEMLAASLEDERTALFVKYFVGNGGLSASEIQNLLPIYREDHALTEH